MNSRNIFGCFFLSLATFGSSAVTLGQVRGNPVLGQRLDLTIEVELEPGSDVGGSCMAADVAFSDSRVDPARIQVAAVPGSRGQSALIRVWSTAVVDEPVVSLSLSAGCQSKTVRKYIFLSQLPDAAQPGDSAFASGATRGTFGGTALPAFKKEAQLSFSASRESRNAARRTGIVASGNSGQSAGAEAMGGVTPDKAGSPNSSKAALAMRQPGAGGARLVLDPSDAFMFEPLSNLKASSELATTPLENSPQRAQAAALWRYLNTDSQDILKEAERVGSLEGDLKAVRDNAAQSHATVTELRSELEQVKTQRYANGLVYALGVLLLLALFAAGYFWRRARTNQNHADWRKDPAETGFRPSAHLELDDPLSQQRSVAPSSISSITHVDVDLAAGNAAPTPSPRSQSPGWAHSGTGGISVTHDFVSSQLTPLLPPKPLRTINPEELFDIQQHADFFVSLGQYDQAIEVLKKHIDDTPETSPLAYLDLLKLYHTLSRIEDYNQLRSEFNRKFSGIVPMFTAFNKQGNGLEAYPAVIERIQDGWFSSDATATLVHAIFRESDVAVESVDLEAFRDLLMLHAVSLTVPAGRVGTTEKTANKAGSGAATVALASAALVAPALQSAPAAQSTLQTGRSTKNASGKADDLPFGPTDFKRESQPDVNAISPANAEATVHLPAGFELDVDLSEKDEANATRSSESPPLPSISNSSMSEMPARSTKPRNDDHLIDFDAFDLPDDADELKKPGSH